MLQKPQIPCRNWCHMKLTFIQKITSFHSLEMVTPFFLQTLCLPHHLSMARCVSSLQSYSIYQTSHTPLYKLWGSQWWLWSRLAHNTTRTSAMLYLLEPIKMHDNEDAWNTNNLPGCDAMLFGRYIYHWFGGRPICCFLHPKDEGSRYLPNSASQPASQPANYTASHAAKP